MDTTKLISPVDPEIEKILDRIFIEDVCKRLGLGKSTVERYIHHGRFPKHAGKVVVAGRSRRYWNPKDLTNSESNPVGLEKRFRRWLCTPLERAALIKTYNLMVCHGNDAQAQVFTKKSRPYAGFLAVSFQEVQFVCRVEADGWTPRNKKGGLVPLDPTKDMKISYTLPEEDTPADTPEDTLKKEPSFLIL